MAVGAGAVGGAGEFKQSRGPTPEGIAAKNARGGVIEEVHRLTFEILDQMPDAVGHEADLLQHPESVSMLLGKLERSSENILENRIGEFCDILEDIFGRSIQKTTLLPKSINYATNSIPG